MHSQQVTALDLLNSASMACHPAFEASFHVCCMLYISRYMYHVYIKCTIYLMNPWQYGHMEHLCLTAARGDDPGTDGFRQKPLPETLRNANQAEALLQRHAKGSQAASKPVDANQAHATRPSDKVTLRQQTLPSMP